jgi:hypothetical protein
VEGKAESISNLETNLRVLDTDAVLCSLIDILASVGVGAIKKMKREACCGGIVWSLPHFIQNES